MPIEGLHGFFIHQLHILWDHEGGLQRIITEKELVSGVLKLAIIMCYEKFTFPVVSQVTLCKVPHGKCN